jgi:hypothetical protein
MVRYESTGTFANNGQVFIDNPALRSLLPTSYKLELNGDARILSLLSTDLPCILAQQQFTKNEWSIFIILLVSFPHYAPHEQLLASITSLSPTDCRKRLQEAEQLGSKALKRELKPVHRALCGIRAKLQDISPYLKISLIRCLGYALTSLSEQEL